MRCVGRVFTARRGDTSYSFAGQCVCVLHARLLLTAAHVCFDGASTLDVCVGFKPADEQPLQIWRATPLRWSGKMDIAVLRVEAEASPFVPLPVATAAAIDRNFSNQLCALASFAVSSDGAAMRAAGQTQAQWDVPVEQLVRLPAVPSFLESKIAAVQLRHYPDPPPARECLLGLSTYLNEKGVSGGAVVGLEGGQLVLLGIHTHNQRLGSAEGYVVSRLQIGECDGGRPASDPNLEAGAGACWSAGEATRDASMAHSAAGSTPDSSGSEAALAQRSDTNSYHSAPDSHSPPLRLGKGVNQQVQAKLQHAVGATMAKSVFVVAHFVLRGRWAADALLDELAPPIVRNSAAGAAGSAAAAAVAAVGLRFGIPPADESPSGSPRLPHDELYGDGQP